MNREPTRLNILRAQNRSAVRRVSSRREAPAEKSFGPGTQGTVGLLNRRAVRGDPRVVLRSMGMIALG